MSATPLSILIIGGYGIVGKDAATLLAANPAFRVTIAGRNKIKARETANALKANWLCLDASDPQQVQEALRNTDVVLNCFIELDRVAPVVAEAAAALGKLYLDVAGVPLAHLHAVKALDAEAKKTGALLVTGLGVNPGMAGLLLKLHALSLQEAHDSDLYFAMGSDLRDVSLLSMRGLGEMLRVPPRFWRNNAWEKPDQSNLTMRVGEPFNKKIWFGPNMITPDIEQIPQQHPFRSIRFWAGIEDAMQSMAMLLGIWMGCAANEHRAARFLKVLKWIGGKKVSNELILTVVTSGLRAGKPVVLTSSLRGSEMYATAVAPVLACEWLVAQPTRPSGAFYATEVLDPAAFVAGLAAKGIPYREEISRA